MSSCKILNYAVVSHSLGRKFFELCKINELTCAYMFSQAHLQKNMHKKVFSLFEISNVCCVFLLRNANIFNLAYQLGITPRKQVIVSFGIRYV
jgi:hypothetical protein